MLLVVMLGGTHRQARIEMHDVAFAVGDSLQAVYPQLRAQWFGEQRGLHVDAWMEVDGVDGWQVRLGAAAPAPGEPRLWFINLGGYERATFGEQHRYLLVVAADRAQAKQAGRAHVAAHWDKPHTDAVFDIDDCIPIDCVDGRYVQLARGPHRPLVFQNDYIVIA